MPYAQIPCLILCLFNQYNLFLTSVNLIYMIEVSIVPGLINKHTIDPNTMNTKRRPLNHHLRPPTTTAQNSLENTSIAANDKFIKRNSLNSPSLTLNLTSSLPCFVVVAVTFARHYSLIMDFSGLLMETKTEEFE